MRARAGDDPFELLQAWYRTVARSIIEERCAQWAAALGLSYGRVSIRAQRTRWGSCTHEGNLSFNWRLVLAPQWVLDAIVVHELCHIDELNHSARFWALLDTRYPRHREADEWLRAHGAELRVSRPSGHAAPPPAATGAGRAWPAHVDRAAAPSRRTSPEPIDNEHDQLLLFDAIDGA